MCTEIILYISFDKSRQLAFAVQNNYFFVFITQHILHELIQAISINILVNSAICFLFVYLAVLSLLSVFSWNKVL